VPDGGLGAIFGTWPNKKGAVEVAAFVMVMILLIADRQGKRKIRQLG
jgi:hypothetical protein